MMIKNNAEKQNYLSYMLYESDKDLFGFPDGIHYDDESRYQKKKRLEKKIIALFESRGFSRIYPPIFEYFRTFENEGSISSSETFNFKERGGELLALRNDMTAPIARLVSMRYQKEDMPLSLYYAGDIFREQSLHRAKERQIHQVGIEFIGENGMESDLKIIEMLGESLEILDDNYTLVIGNVKIFAYIKNLLRFPDGPEGISLSKALQKAFSRKDRVSLNILLDQFDQSEGLRQLILNCASSCGRPEDLLGHIPEKHQELKDIVLEIRELFRKLEESVCSNCVFDPSLIKEFSYYTSMTLEGYISSEGSPVANGGRYDGLFKQFNRTEPAVGFAINLTESITGNDV